MQNKSIKFLIIRFSSIGDIVLTTPVIRGLKEQVENAEIHFLCKKAYFDVVKNNRYIDKIHLFDENFSVLVHELKLEHLNYIIDLHHNIRSSRLKNSLGLPEFSFDKLNKEKWLMVNFNINRLPKTHIVDRYLETCRVFDVQKDNKGLDYFLSDADKLNLSELNLSANNYVAFVIGATHPTKRLPNEKIISICKQIEGKIVLLGGKEDIKNAKIIKEVLSNERIIDTCGKFKLNESAYLVQQSRIVISHDTGLMHIAAAFKKQIISIWGNTVPEFGMYPYLSAKNSEIIEVKGLKCRPCTKIGFRACPKKHFKCMNLIDEKKIIKRVN